MKFLIHAALTLLAIVGLVRGVPSAYSDITTFNVNNGAYAPQAIDPIYQALDCEGIHDYCNRNPIPLNAIDVDNGREIIGWEVVCEGEVVVAQGTGTGNPEDQRDVPRSFGKIVLKYAPVPPPPPK